MRILLIGGSGYVGSLLLPFLSREHDVVVFDRRPPTSGAFIRGDATDLPSLRDATKGVDVVIHCAMGSDDLDPAVGAAEAYDVNVKSVHLALLAAHENGVPHAVHISSLSVYRDLLDRTLTGDEPSDATDLYGLTKHLGEQVCAAAVREWDMTVTILRLTWPTADTDWPAWTRWGEPILHHTGDGVLVEPTAASDLAAAVLSAVDYRDGCSTFLISGDTSARRWSIAKARQLLGWEPSPRSHDAPGARGA
ncbi:MAG: NAD(P)-dependent oxidoreductase [Hamadaea sp.]|uniref:NAD-dependent epimerase/dehydratase family protein n=1 Tax=Hamadaea sp. TaxID=2024425 RepID=UPI00181D230F|nr:NAD(P)-dependent oxidoreductase [Hamadaea sp.]NUR73733.1 NAD(P)-dependent oxidoreductase [Hamadaea sp.]NUT19100.1 NAD(P)-dependent oxidoreductase [Hamadaea sp.]